MITEGVQAGESYDLSNCDKEPIHIPGRIQSHGVLFAIVEPDLIVAQVSLNASGVMGRPVDALLGSPIDRIVDAEDAERCRRWLLSPELGGTNPERIRVGGRCFDASAHRHDGMIILELEDVRDADKSPTADYRAVRNSMGRLQGAATFDDFCRIAVAEMRAMSGFDRVTVYQFDPAWNGRVVAEAKRDDLNSWLGLHFPASDIPEQARRLYHINTIRLVADVDEETSPIVPAISPITGRPLDLSFSVLRGLSPIHVQYLKNMGVRASMSVSLMREGRLWGLFTCHNYGSARHLAPVVRDACAFLGQVVSVQLAVKEDSEGHEHREQLRSIRESLLQRMSSEADLLRSLPGEELLELTGASGAAIFQDGRCVMTGVTPTEEQIKRLVGWLRIHGEGDVFQTDSLARIYPEAEEFKDVASGLVAISTTRVEGHHVLWFRPEVVHTVDWGGDPRKPSDLQSGAGTLGPRRSFELWREEVRLKSLPWHRWEIDAVRLLRDAIMAVVVRRAEELTRLNAELERSNADLDSFAFITSHDLKEPLRGINNYATFVMEDYADKLDDAGKDKLQTLIRLSQRLEDIVESLLRYSRLGRADLAVQEIDLNPVLASILDLYDQTLVRERAEVSIPRPLPVARCDKTQAEILFANLITNAIKYNDKPDRRVEVGFLEPVDGANRRPVFFVRDNGIGIPEKHRHAIFRMFKRLHGRDKFGGGTGAGLAFSKKIVERHGGTIWVESTINEGSTFYFTLES